MSNNKFSILFSVKLVSNQISPNLGVKDIFSAWFMSGKNLDTIFEQNFYTKNYILTNAARTSLGIIADVVNPNKKKKIGLPAFICAVVATPFLSRGYAIEWIDTDENGLIDLKDFEKKSNNISLLVVPHIFGQPAPLKAIMQIAKSKQIFVIEDGAHLIRQLSEPHFEFITDAQILSFGREKVVSCVSGGALIWPEGSPYASGFADYGLLKPSFGQQFRLACQPLIFGLSLPWWHLGGKIIPWIFRTINFLPLAVTPAEKEGQEDLPELQLGNFQKKLLAHQLKIFEHQNIHAQALALKWQETLEDLFPEAEIIRPPNAFRVITKNLPQEAKTKISALTSFNLRDWDGVPISPNGVNLKKFGYTKGQCPNAEKLAQIYVTFPTNKRTSKKDLTAFAKFFTSE